LIDWCLTPSLAVFQHEQILLPDIQWVAVVYSNSLTLGFFCKAIISFFTKLNIAKLQNSSQIL
jgi:hypothetical protein